MKTDIYRKRDHVVTRRIAGETLLVPVKARLADMRRVYVLHGSGEFIWERFDGTRPLAGIVDDVVAGFDVDRARAGADLDELIAALLETGLIEKVG